MIKLSFKLPTGLQIEYEGEEDALDAVLETVLAVPGAAQAPGPKPPLGDDHTLDDEPGEEGDGPLDPRTLQARLDRVGAGSDIERVTVMAQAAVEAGREGIDFGTANRLYDALAIRKPKQWKATFSNAKTKGFVQNAGRGIWRPTVPGENFAKYGPPGAQAKRRPASRESAENGQPEGGENNS